MAWGAGDQRGLLARLFGFGRMPAAGADAGGRDLQSAFKTAMRRNAGTIAVITAAKGDRLGGITSTSFNSLSVDPPSIFFGLGNDASVYDLFLESGAFAVNMLGEDQADIAELFADQHRRSQRFTKAQWSRSAGGAPIIEGGIAAAVECRLHTHLRAFTHTIIVGVVERVRIGSSRPLVYEGGGYARAVALSQTGRRA